jgi:hypothetical protein
MAKESGLGATVSVDDSGGTPRDISNDITEVSISTPRGIQEVTGINVSGMERILLLADIETELNGVFNDAANMSHVVLKTVTNTSVARTTAFAVSGQTLSCEEVYDNYELSRSDYGEKAFYGGTARHH